MAVAQHITIHSEQENQNHPFKLLQLSAVIVKRRWSHIQAYITVFSIMLLTFTSLGFLYLYWLWRSKLYSLKMTITKTK